MGVRSRLASVALASVIFTLGLSAHAEESGPARARAKEAYDRGLAAHKQGDYAKAAEEFARADALAPSAVALQAALEATLTIDDPVLGSELLERSKREQAHGTLATAVDSAQARFSGRAGRLRVNCEGARPCTSTVDGAPIETRRAIWVRIGQHTVVVQADNDTQTKTVDVKPEQITDVGTSAATEPSPEALHVTTSQGSANKLPKAVFWTGVGVTGVVGILATYFALDTKGRHTDFTDAGCTQSNATGCGALKDDGQSAQARANVTIGGAIVLGAATAVIGAFFTDWDSHPTTGRAFVSPIAGGTVGGLSGTF
ncbi:hypothetical protein AKJ09_11217 [Labilithrix luteola]|uniref:Uncharacterized protein n=1 Tax=Labilithrix luteola TaxID=1391654 RepID=A0A0K1QFL2_9BACT|nr:hypothetical protein [Labilithrix luteola]AKV04554.1 hypothetical protein AKJ09_11217 [Labilithrix luteola]